MRFLCPGLSPRARGTRIHASGLSPAIGPIPAGAGEPLSGSRKVAKSWAYPRGRGGTLRGIDEGIDHEGLSPRARGNRRSDGGVPGAQGPIPAGAGEPTPRRIGCPRPWAYPRGRGGTWLSCCRLAKLPGLSPRARGNLAVLLSSGQAAGPIPAGAGEPQSLGPVTGPCRAYPRGRGGTAWSARAGYPGEGLSPRARGNPSQTSRTCTYCGPIPAGAGEPCPGVYSASIARAYPRGRGGTVTRIT